MADEYINRTIAVKGLRMAHDADGAEFVRLIPAADVVEVVRCGECEWWTKQEASCQGRCARYGFYPTSTWYCAAGAKMEEKE